MTWWMLLVVIVAPLAAFAFAWSLGRVGDHALEHPRKAVRNSLWISAMMAALFTVQSVSQWSEGRSGPGFWLGVLGAVLAAVNFGLGARELKRLG